METPPTATPAVAPPVMAWFRVYCGIMATLYLVCSPMGFVMFLDDTIGDEERLFMIGFGIIMALICLLLMVAYLLPFFLKPKPWVWIYDIVLICIGLSSACFLPICIPLLIFWLKPETKAWFGRT